MESIGAKFRAAREAKGYSLEQVARDTHISRRFLQAIEEEDFAQFPGEPYLLGFLRSYSEFLDLDPRETVALYKNLKLQEQPAPIDELLVRRSPRPFILAAVAVIVLAGAVAGGILFFTSDFFQSRRARAEVADSGGREYIMENEIMEQRFVQGDTIRVPVRDGEYPLLLAEIGDTVALDSPAGRHSLPPAQEQTIDITEDGRPDLRVTVREINRRQTPASAVVRFDRGVQLPVGVTDDTLMADGSPTRTEAIGSTTVAERERSASVIAEFAARRPISLQFEFTAPTMLRALIDGNRRSEQFFQSGQSYSATAESNAQVWLSNAGATRLIVEGRELSLGRPGQVSAFLIGWVDGPGNVRLEMVPVY
ncbi:MAG: helix-turn-helix domain-containing protein [Spirochaetaceae bacterium]|nr:MAG: helix-turn-helix domain-containing protein [Spirochaetaceae bacterium]